MGVIVFMKKKKINEKRTHGINNNRQTFAGFSTNTPKVNCVRSSLTPVPLMLTLKC